MKQVDLIPSASLAAMREPAFPGESPAYAAAREALLAEEIEVRRHLSSLAAQRRRLPDGPVIAKNYRFLDREGRELGLTDLFGRHGTLITYFWMFGPERERACPMCTNFLGGLNGNAADIGQRAALWILGRSPADRQLAFAAERGWQHLDFLQIVGDDYAHDLRVLDENKSESPALTVYRRDGDTVRLFYNAEMPAVAADPGEDPRGPVDIAPLWNMLDLTPEGRGQDWYPALSY